MREIGLARDDSPNQTAAACELALESLVAQRRLTRTDSGSYSRAPRRKPKGKGPQGSFVPPTFDV